MKESTYKFLVIFLIAVILICGCLMGLRAWKNLRDPAPEVASDPAPDFAMTDPDGEEVSLSDFVGTPVVINFWATWCGPCKMELPCFQTAFEEYGDEVRFLMVNMGPAFSDSEEAVQALMAENSYTFPVYYDTWAEAASAYQITAIPMTVFIGADGAVVSQNVGAMTRDQLEEGIQSILTD